jgi:CheY-like chemotaxis protein
MVIDDDKEFLEGLQETLELSGYDLTVVNDSTKVLDITNKTRPDIILLDLKMP